jgi:hypothetical protein
VAKRSQEPLKTKFFYFPSVRVQDSPDYLGLAGKDLTPGKMIKE